VVVKALEVKGLVVKAVVRLTAVTVYIGSTATLRSTDGGRVATRRIRVLHASATPVKDSKKRRAPKSITSPANTAQVATLCKYYCRCLVDENARFSAIFSTYEISKLMGEPCPCNGFP